MFSCVPLLLMHCVVNVTLFVARCVLCVACKLLSVVCNCPCVMCVVTCCWMFVVGVVWLLIVVD